MGDPTDKDTSEARSPGPDDVSFDLEATLSAVVTLRSRIPADALTAQALGTERSGSGVLIGEDGLIVTIGYLIAEAHEVWVSYGRSRTLPGYVVGYDHDTGFGLVRTVGAPAAAPIPMGSCRDLQVSDVVVAASGGADGAILTQVVGRSEFAGYWEYVIDDAIFTAPPIPNWGGAALLSRSGALLAVGSLLVQHKTTGEEVMNSNMFVPIDLLEPIREELIAHGRPDRPPRPWLGLFVQENNGELVVAGAYPKCPADAAGVCPGDVVLEVGGEPVSGLAEFFRRIWAQGEAGVEVPLTLVRDGETRSVRVQSIDRATRMTPGPLH